MTLLPIEETLPRLAARSAASLENIRARQCSGEYMHGVPCTHDDRVHGRNAVCTDCGSAGYAAHRGRALLLENFSPANGQLE
jgi:hypothetical protein